MTNYLKYLEENIHSVILASVDEEQNPVTCVIDMMLSDDNALYFLTARGKSLYQRLKNKENISITGLEGKDTLSAKSISIRAKAREIGSDLLLEIFEKNPYMKDIYPSEESRKILTVFQVYEGEGEFFDLSVRPIFRENFTFGEREQKQRGYFISKSCILCGECVDVCPQNCIVLEKDKSSIKSENCLYCGLCFAICPVQAIEKFE